MLDRNPVLTLILILAAIVVLIWLGVAKFIAMFLGTIFALIFQFIWNDVLPWPTCTMPQHRGDWDTCAGIGVIYLPLTVIVTFGIMIGVPVLFWAMLRSIRD